MIYLLDTNTLISFFKGMGRVGERLLTTPPRQIAVSCITLFELQVGLAKSAAPKKRSAQLDELMALVTLLPFGAAEAKSAADIRARLERKGQPIGPRDNLIAGTAKVRGATLVTHNTAAFRRVRGLKLIDWY